MPNKTIGHGLKDCLLSENTKKFLEEGKLVVGVASVVCVVSHRCPIFMIFGILQEYCMRLLVLPDTFMYTTFSVASLVASNHRFLLHLRRYILKYCLN